MRMIDTVSLKLFVAVSEEKSIELASQREGIVRSAVSKRISAMEADLGAKLLVRKQRGVDLTPAGLALERYARDILASMERIQSDLKLIRSRPQGHVRIVAAMSTTDQQLLDDIADFLRRNESIDVSVTEKLAVEAIRAVDDGRADIGICWEGKHTRGMDCTPYRDDAHCLVVPRGHRLADGDEVSFAEILDHDLIDIAPGCIMSVRMQKEAALLGKVMARARIQVNTFDAAAQAVCRGLGIAVMPVGLCGAYDDLREIPIKDAWTRRRIVLCLKDGPEPSPATRLFLEELGNRRQSRPLMPDTSLESLAAAD